MSQSRALAAPTYTPTNKPRRAIPTDRDLIGFEILARYAYARIDALHAFMGGSEEGLVTHWKHLQRAPNEFVYRHPQQWRHTDAYHRRTVYGLGRNGYDFLAHRGISYSFRSQARNLQHELMWAEFLLSLEYGATITDGIRPLRWHYEIKNSKNLPKSTQLAADPFTIQYDKKKFKVNLPNGQTMDEERIVTITPDGFPMGIEDRRSGTPKFTFLVVEADCDSEGIKSDIVEKYKAYIKIIHEELFVDHYGFPNFYVVFLTTGLTHLRNMQAALLDLTKDKEILQYFLFRTFPTIYTFERPIKPNGCMLFTDYERVGLPPFNFLRHDTIA